MYPSRLLINLKDIKKPRGKVLRFWNKHQRIQNFEKNLEFTLENLNGNFTF